MGKLLPILFLSLYSPTTFYSYFDFEKKKEKKGKKKRSRFFFFFLFPQGTTFSPNIKV